MDAIRKYRCKLGLTEKELAMRVGICRQYLNRLENGSRRNPSYNVLSKLAQELGVTVNDLVNNTDV